MPLRIANAAGFLGDWIDAPRRLVDRAQIDYLTLEYLAELTLSILARAKEKNPQLGYAEDYIEVLRSLVDPLKRQPQPKIVTNAGGMNPLACAAAAGKVLGDAGLGGTTIGVVTGDDLLPRIDELPASGCDLKHFTTGAPLVDRSLIVSANAYLGAQPIADALAQGARIVITGRVADASLTVGPAMHELGGDWDDWDRLARFSVAGHLIECGAQVTGGYSVDWMTHGLTDVGYPIAEIEADGNCVITKPAGSGGAVNRRTAVEQLVYEIGDPRHYLTPDVDCDFTTVEVTDLGGDRVRVQGATGRPAPDSLKVSLAYRDGYFASGQLLVYGSDCIAKAKAASDIVRERLKLASCEPQHWLVELLGAGDGCPLAAPQKCNPAEVMLRITARDSRREVLERFTREFAPLITSGPAGLAGYAAGRPTVRPVYAYWPTLVPKQLVPAIVEVRTAQEWLA
jgi:hypothetical protein